MLNKTLVALPDKPYLIMSPFINSQKVKMREEGGWVFARESDLQPPDDWDFRTTKLAAKLNGSMSMARAWAEVYDNKYGAYYQRQLLVRDFFSQFEEPPLRNKWKKYPWGILSSKEETRRYNMWKTGTTGYDVIDASMLQLKQTGWINNRQRMLCASYLSKNLLVDWQRGEAYFARELIDYNKSSNKGNWAWVGGAGFNTRLTDVLNPDLQRRKLDPDGTLVEKYLNNRGVIEPEFLYKETKKTWLSVIT
jgi:deoxyribodipyrimidine photo-lyase